MTYYDKLKQGHPDYSEEQLRDIRRTMCPSSFGMEDPTDCGEPHGTVCKDCWTREIVEDKPTLDKAFNCKSCVHSEVCIYQGQFTKIMNATEHIGGITANVMDRTIDLNNTSYIKLDISCKHYKKKAEVTYRGV